MSLSQAAVSTSSQALCHPICFGGCSGPLTSDCYSCVPHSAQRSFVCICDEYWTGDDCTIYAAPSTIAPCPARCFSCAGARPGSWFACVANAHMDHTGNCFCNSYYSGDDCMVWSGPCHPTCYASGGCDGPSQNDCLQCQGHSSINAYGTCVWDPGYSGINCLTYTGQCDPMCVGCDGPGTNYCISCVPHSYQDQYGRCTCQENYSSVAWDLYSGMCDPAWVGCTGPGAASCLQCRENAAYRSPIDRTCVCLTGWTGDGCNIYMGICDIMCQDCIGPGPAACVGCIGHASKSVDFQCVCQVDYTGQRCEFFIGQCHKLCNGCTGPTEFDCMSCTTNATMDEISYMCRCNDGWSGQTCENYSGDCNEICNQSSGCTGPTPLECVECTYYASFNSTTGCVCDEGWGGAYCEDFVGECHHLCNSCYGSGANNCHACIEHAEPDSHNFCHCEWNYSGEDCQIYTGSCPDVCNGCTGNSPYNCLQCIDNADWHYSQDDFDRYCACRRGFMGVGCDTYTGDCDPKCDYLYSCTGPTPGDCNRCAENAYLKISDSITGRLECACTPDYVGEYWEFYTGLCDPKCQTDETGTITYDVPYGSNNCKGPTSADCSRCVDTAGRDGSGQCLCNENYTGDDCSQYRGPCEQLCALCGKLETTNDANCIVCKVNAALNVTSGRCECTSDWSGSDCLYYIGACHDTCLTCNGPDPDQCTKCVPNSAKDYAGICTCLPEYSGATCSSFDGQWHSKCNSVASCSGATAYDCEQCASHAYQTNDRECVCEGNWGGQTCDDYIGEWGYACQYCKAVDGVASCVQCFTNASADGVFDCACNQGYGGERCESYIGVCSPMCKNCTGPNIHECRACGKNSGRDNYGICTCLHGFEYTATGCEPMTDSDVCYSLCETCAGPLKSDCVTCKSYASRKWSDTELKGEWECDPGYVEPDCQLYQGPCHPHWQGCIGPSETQCDSCVENAHWTSEDNSSTSFCMWDLEWGGVDCSRWVGICFPTCVSCWQYGAHACSSCAPHAYRNYNGDCVCLVEYEGQLDCSEYTGMCDLKCDQAAGCTGPLASDCNACASGGHIVPKYGYVDLDQVQYDAINLGNDPTKKMCGCEQDWAGDDCSIFTGACDPKCRSGCRAPKLCTQWVDSAEFNADGHCECSADWYGEECEYYGGKCDSKCVNCTGRSGYDCIKCTVNAHRSQSYTSSDWASSSYSIESTPFPPMSQNSNPTQQASGECICNDHWTGESCNVWNGPCSPTCLIDEDATRANCSADGKTCIACKENSYRNDFGECVCNKDWNGNPECTVYSGKCDPKCTWCSGPADTDCTLCAQHAEMDSDNRCICKSDYVGDDCGMYAGLCDTKCDGCNGPTAWDCYRCIDGAKRQHSLILGVDDHYNPGMIDHFYGFSTYDLPTPTIPAWQTDWGRCVCENRFTGDSCQFQAIKCSYSCAICDEDDPTLCISCNAGYGLMNNGCVACHMACNTCQGPENGQCQSCQNGFFLKNGSTCEPCYPACTTCAGTATTCTSCQVDMTLSTNTCTCNLNLPTTVYNKDSFCVALCPFGEDYNNGYVDITGSNPTNGICPDVNRYYGFWHPDVNSHTRILHNWLSGDASDYFDERGMYVGDKYDYDNKFTPTQYLFGHFYLGVFFKLDDIGGTILHFRHQFNNAWARWQNFECYPYLACFDTEQIFDVEIWQTPCGEVIVEYPGFTYKFPKENFVVGGWNAVYIGTRPVTCGDLNCSGVLVRVGLNSIEYEAKSEGNWVLSHDMRDEALVTFGAYRIYQDAEVTSDTIDPAQGFYSGMWAGFTSEYSNVVSFTVSAPTFDDLFRNGTNDPDNPGCWVPDDSPFRIDDSTWICYSLCPIGTYIDGSECTVCSPTCTNLSCIDGNDWLLCADDLCLRCPTDQNICETWVNHYAAPNTDGLCICPAHYVQTEPGTCRPPCASGCERCISEDINHCYLCQDNYRLDRDPLGKCVPCTYSEEITVEVGSCDFKSHRARSGECKCADNQWRDEDRGVCRDCPVHCMNCGESFICDQCEDGYLKPKDAQLCFRYCSTGFEVDYVNNVCTGSQGLVADFQWGAQGSINRISSDEWRYQGTLGNAEWTVSACMGTRYEWELVDPWLTDDRGLYFDGIDDFVTIFGLVVHHTFTMTFWMKPDTSGTLYSSSTINDNRFEQYWAIKLEGSRLNFEDATNNYDELTKEIFTMGDWNHLGFTASWTEQERKTYISIYRDGKAKERKSLDFIIIDHRDSSSKNRWLLDDNDELYNRHLIGVTEFREVRHSLYQGFIYEWSYLNYEVKNYALQVSHSCSGCSVCPPAAGCLGSCPSGKYPVDDKCHNCPAFCPRGCYSDGTC